MPRSASASAGQDSFPTTVNIPYLHASLLSLHFRMTYLTPSMCFLVVVIILFFLHSSGILVANHCSY
jgi:hypothetical protein